MAKLTFTEYVKARRVTNTPAGDFVADAKADRGMPDVKSWEQLHTYLVMKSAIPEAIAAGKAVWRGYQAKLRR
jgi:hypothetical protein